MNFEGADLFFVGRDGWAVKIHCTLLRDALITERTVYDDQGIVLGTSRSHSTGTRKTLLRQVLGLLNDGGVA